MSSVTWQAARKARANKEWLILMLHYLVEEPKTDIEYSIEDFKALLAEVKKSEITVLPLAQVFEACGRPKPDAEGRCSVNGSLPAARAK